MIVMTERAGLVVVTACPSIQVWKPIDASDVFITTTATEPSRFANAVARSGSQLEDAMMRRAPGRLGPPERGSSRTARAGIHRPDRRTDLFHSYA